MKLLTIRGKVKQTLIKSFNDGEGNKLTDSFSIANCLNHHFATVGKTMAEKIDAIGSDRLKDPLSYISNDVKNSLFLSIPKAHEISKIISKLDEKKSSHGIISNKVLKVINETISPYLEILFHKCIISGVFPDCFKIAEVIPLFKGGEKEDKNCYRPISLLPTISKIFERVLATRLISFFTKFNVLSKDQFGFRAKFSTEYAIADIYDKLINNLDKGLSSCAIFLDLAKAFDSVSHEILLRKLHYYGVRGKALELFKSYLSCRSQFVKLNGVKSSLARVEFGVPQGSILGPLLFLIFINDLPNASKFYIKLFADDTFLCAQNKDFADLERDVNTELDKVFIWLASNKLTLNTDKSKFMIVSNKKNIPNLSVKVNKLSLKSCDSYKYLGVMIDKKLNWKSHVKYIGTKISKACGALAKLRNCVGIDILKNVYHALVHSYLRYGILVWGHATKSVLKPLEILANKAIRIMTFAPFGNIDLKSVYHELKLLEVPRICRLETGNFEYKHQNNLLPI